MLFKYMSTCIHILHNCLCGREVLLRNGSQYLNFFQIRFIDIADNDKQTLFIWQINFNIKNVKQHFIFCQ